MKKKIKTQFGFGFGFFLYSILLSSLLFSACSQPSQNDDASVMLALKKSLGPFSDALKWSDPDPCNWTRVVCSDDNRVTRIQIGRRSLRGTFPPNLQNLTELTHLELQWNNSSGPLPSFSGLSSLQVLMLSNNISGPEARESFQMATVIPALTTV